MILLIDNYDSFTYNLYQLIGSINADIKVIRSDECTIDEIIALAPEAILISPGPGRPKEAGICEELVKAVKGKIKILGICLGHQAICEAFGGKIVKAKELVHGKQSITAVNTKDPLFKNLPATIKTARYHSLAVDLKNVKDKLLVLATAEDGEVMAVRHKNYPLYGVQFHPESILTPQGITIIKNFLKEI